MHFHDDSAKDPRWMHEAIKEAHKTHWNLSITASVCPMMFHSPTALSYTPKICAERKEKKFLETTCCRTGRRFLHPDCSSNVTHGEWNWNRNDGCFGGLEV